MLHEISFSEAKKHLSELPARLAKTHGALVIVDNHQPVMVLMPWSVYDDIIKTLEQWSDKDLIASLRQGICEMDVPAPAKKRPAKKAKKR